MGYRGERGRSESRLSSNRRGEFPVDDPERLTFCLRRSIATRALGTVAILAALLTGASEKACSEGFNPQRKFPDTTQGYYEDVHGFMVEWFGFRGNTADWKLQQNRILKALTNGKIFIAQNGVDAGRPDHRLWYLGNFLLLKHDRSYINMFARAPGLDGQLHWWPEYDLNLGRPSRPGVPKDIDQLRHGSGIYFRQYQRGLVLLNPTDEERSVRTAGKVPYYQVEPWGGGIIDRAGQMPRGGLKIAPAPKEITLGPWSGAILLTTPKNVGR